MADDAPNPAPVFKKRAKATFKRKHSSSGAEDNDVEAASSQHISVAEILRQRRQGKVKRSAIEASAPGQDDILRAVVPSANGTEESDIDRMKNRFVAQTGQVVGLYDKQMNDFIDAKMAEYRNQPTGNTNTNNHNEASKPDQARSPTNTTFEAAETSNGASERPPDKLSVAAGKLMEVDLGGTLSKHEEEAAAKAAKPVKVRLGRDGKPWRPRKRRNSDALARDALIDSIMKENSLSRFQDGARPVAATSGNTSSVAPAESEYIDEDRVLENFKSNYQDPERRHVRKPPATGKQDQAKGPKMGGSKNTRRAVAEEQAKAKNA